MVRLLLCSDGTAETIAGAFFLQGSAANEPGVDAYACEGTARQYVGSASVVVDVCDESGANCSVAQTGEIDRRELACGKLDDIAVAFTGLHPKDVFLTRIEASLPRAALAEDLIVTAADDQSSVQNRMQAQLGVNNCWDQDKALLPPVATTPKQPPMSPRDLVLLTLGLIGVGLAARRRRSRDSEVLA